MSSAQSLEDMQRQLMEKASEDAGFRAQLMEDPKAIVLQEFGITIPDSINIQVHETNMNNVHLVLPPSPRVDEEELQRISGGFWE